DQHLFAAHSVAKVAGQDPAERSCNKPECEARKCTQLGCRGAIGWEELWTKNQCGARGIKIKVVPLDCGAHKCCAHCAPGFGALCGSTQPREVCGTSSGVCPGHNVILSKGPSLPVAQRTHQHPEPFRSPEI